MKIRDQERVYIVGNNTGVGKTIVSAILTEAFEADYWKPIQAGDLDNSDSNTVSHLISNSTSQIHPEAFLLQEPISPHAAAEREGIEISLESITVPHTSRQLIIESAGGILSPVNRKATMRDLAMHLKAPALVVSRHYLGSINHTLLTLEALKAKQIPVLGVIFVGDPEPESETVIVGMGGTKMLGRIAWEASFSPMLVSQYARLLREIL